MPHQRGLFDFGADHDAGTVAQEQQRDVERVAQLHEARRLVGAGTVDGAGEMRRIVRDHADRPTLDANERRDDAVAETAADLEHRVGVGERVDHFAHVVHAQAILGNRGPQQPLIRARPFLHRSLEVAQVFLRHRHGFDLVLHRDVDDAVRHLHAHRADFLRAEHAEAAAFDHRRPPNADVGAFASQSPRRNSRAARRCRRNSAPT